MNYIVLDLEWNQCPAGKDREIAHLPFEIIEIGAVRLDENHVPSGRFHEIVRPQVYTSLHFRTKEIVTIREKDLQRPEPSRRSPLISLYGAGKILIFAHGGLPT